MSSLIGFISIALVVLLTFFIGLRLPKISNILFVALIIRVIFLLLGNYFITLPDSTADAQTFEEEAWHMAREGYFYVLSQFKGPDPRFISWLIAIPYSLLGRSLLMAQAISLLFGIGSVFLGWLLANKLWNIDIANKVGWTMALFPSLVLYSVLVMRESYVVFFLLLALYGIAAWVKTNNYKSIIIIMLGFGGATFFHGAMIIGGMVFLLVLGVVNLKKILRLLINARANIKNLVFLMLFLTISSLYLLNKFSIPYLGYFANSTNINVILRKTTYSTRGDSSWPEWTIIRSPTELLYKLPARSMYVIFSPFPWEVSKPKHLIGILDAFLYMYLSYLMFLNRKIIWRDPTLRIFLLILLCYIIIFAVGVGNFGTGIRHRSKFVVLFILLAAPLLKRFTFFKNRKK